MNSIELSYDKQLPQEEVPGLALLERARSLPHANGSLLDHLVGTWRILRACKQPDDVAIAGLIHSVYSTQFYPHALFSIESRTLIRSVFGNCAEDLAYDFCQLDRPAIWSQRKPNAFPEVCYGEYLDSGESVTIPQRKADQLLVVECANYIEQCSCTAEVAEPFMAWCLSLSSKCVDLYRVSPTADCSLTETREDEAIECYKSVLRARSPTLTDIHELITINPYAAEPHILLGALKLVHGDPIGALASLNQAHMQLVFWGTPWDMRLSYDDWIITVKRFAGICRDPTAGFSQRASKLLDAILERDGN